MIQRERINEASLLVTLGNRCAAADALVPLHKARIFGMSNEQVLCIIYLCSIFYVQEPGRGIFRVCWGGLSGKTLPAFWLSVLHLIRRSLCRSLFLWMCVYVALCLWSMWKCTCMFIAGFCLMRSDKYPQLRAENQDLTRWSNKENVNKTHYSLLLHSQMYF